MAATVKKSLITAITAAGTLVVLPSALGQETELIVISGDNQTTFAVETVATPEDIERGLMGRDELALNTGMLFDFGDVRPAEMWMKDTPLFLDMLFIDADGRILAIAKNAAPGSERRIGPGLPVRAVLEVSGGTADELSISPGDIISHTIFGTSN
ncbi:MAG: DUF192 domain-containing protein [Pseudomonadota bacterium]